MNILPTIARDIFKSAYDGRLPLWQAFWLLYAPVLIGYIIFCCCVLWLLFKTDMYPQFSLKGFLVIFIVGSLIVTVPITYLVWLCAKNTKKILWVYLAKGYTLAFVVLLWIFACISIPFILNFVSHGI